MRDRSIPGSVAALPRGLQHPQQQLRLARAAATDAAVDDERRHGSDAELCRQALVGANLIGEAVAGEQDGDLVVGETDFGGERSQRLGIADQQPVGEMRACATVSPYLRERTSAASPSISAGAFGSARSSAR